MSNPSKSSPGEHDYEQQLREVNEALLISSVRQHELTDEAQKSAAALRDSEERYRTLADQVKDYAIFRTDPQGRATTWNEGVRRVLGFDQREFVGADIASAIFTPEDVQAGVPQAELRTADQTGSASDDRWMRRKDGTRFWASGTTSALRNEAGELIGFTKVLRDQTEAKRAEEALRDSEDQLRRAIEEAPIPVIMHAEDGEVLQVSRTWRELTGYSLEDNSIIQSWLTTAYGHGADDLRTAVQRLFGSENVMRAVPFEIVTRAGERRVWSFSASSPGTLSDGRRFIIGMADDITSRKRAEQARHESDEQLGRELAAMQRLQETSIQLIREDNPEALYGEILDAAVAIMRADYASIQMFEPAAGAAGELRLLGHKGFSTEATSFWKSLRPASESTCGVALRTRRRVIVPDVEKSGFMAGSRVLEMYLHAGVHAVQTTPLLSRGGQLVGMISTHWREPHQPADQELRVLDVLARQAADLIERARADEDLRQSEERFRTVADSSPVMIWMTDAQGRTTFLNRTHLTYFGIAAEEGAVLEWSGTIHPDDRDAYTGAFHTALQKRQGFEQRARLRRFDGAWRWFESRGNPIFGGDGEMEGFIGSSADITEIYESQQALIELDKRKDEFLANMSHEIRSPLTGIMGYADLLLGKLKDPEDIECLNIIKECGDHLVEIVNDILDLAKIEAGKLALHTEPVPVHSILIEVQNAMDARARQKKLPLSLRYDTALPENIQTDRTRLRQILINLVSNAIKFTERGRVEMVARFNGNESLFEVEVIDTGIGIAPEHQQSLFRPFSQADTSSAREYGGTGLGLAITKRLVEMLGGKISFESELDKGSVFRVTLPVGSNGAAEPEQHPAAEAHAGRPTAAILENRRVLVVDDRKEICYLVSRYIGEAGGRPETALSSKNALDAVENAAPEPFDAIILDMHMPGMDGFDVARALRAKGFQTPIIAVTAGAMVGDREKCLRAGCDDYLTKPIDRQKLIELLGRHMKSDGTAARANDRGG